MTTLLITLEIKSMKNVYKLILNTIKIYLIGGFLSNLLLFFLVLSDPYFYKLDFPEQNFAIKIVKYFSFTVYIPLFFLLVFSIIKTIKTPFKIDKIIIGLSSLLGIIIFIVIDKIIKKYIIYPDYILLSLILSSSIYGVVLFLIFRKKIIGSVSG